MATEYIVLPKERANQMQTMPSPVRDPDTLSRSLDTKTYFNLDKEMRDILMRNDLSAEDKLLLYNRALSKFMVFKDRHFQSSIPTVKVQEPSMSSRLPSTVIQPPVEAMESSMPTITEGASERMFAAAPTKETIISHLGKNKRQRATQLLNFLEQNKDFTWTNNGNIVVKGKVIPTMTIYDLLFDYITPSVKDRNMPGIKFVDSLLAEQGVPSTYITNFSRKKSIRSFQDQPIQEVAISSSTKKQKKKRHVDYNGDSHKLKRIPWVQ